jgi:hypothetical protein
VEIATDIATERAVATVDAVVDADVVSIDCFMDSRCFLLSICFILAFSHKYSFFEATTEFLRKSTTANEIACAIGDLIHVNEIPE